MAIALKPQWRSIGIHRPWEDGASFILGVFVVASPLVLDPGEGMHVALNAVIIGLLICGVSALEIGELRNWEDWANFALGIWLIVSPPVLGYSHAASLATAHYILGALIAVLAALEYWQDSRRTTTAE
jgi:riboflavin transporter FmnP